tara:strand:+ start:184 stop:1323 length:1140 start_codon:yes stop_codon:yes gene_type:complete
LHIFQLLDLKKGFSLPLWVAGAAKASVKKLLGFVFEENEFITIPKRESDIKIKIHSSSLIQGNSHALAISFVSSGLDLDITENLEIWTIASFKKISESTNQEKLLNIVPGYGVGVNKETSEICISNFANEVLQENLLELIPSGHILNLEIIFPNGKYLAERTSNEAFGVVNGLSIIGTTAETHASASPSQLKNAKSELENIISNNSSNTIVFAIGENGLDLFSHLKIDFPILKVGNWLGPMLVEASIRKIDQILLFGYHGKLIKLAGGIFHTHNHLADARIEILVYHALKENIPFSLLLKISQSKTIEDALREIDSISPQTAKSLWTKISNTVEIRSFEYVKRYVSSSSKIGAVLFDKSRSIRWAGENAKMILSGLDIF